MSFFIALNNVLSIMLTVAPVSIKKSIFLPPVLSVTVLRFESFDLMPKT